MKNFKTNKRSLMGYETKLEKKEPSRERDSQLFSVEKNAERKRDANLLQIDF